MQTKDIIISTATEEIIKNGYASLSQKKVASKIGISPGNLTYHFPSKSDLIKAVVDRWFSDWEIEFEHQILNNIENNGKNIGEFIDWVMKSAIKDDNARMFRELWAMANHDPKVATMLNELYSKAIEQAAKKINLSVDSTSHQEVVDLLYFLACVSEGSVAVFSGKNFDSAMTEKLHKTVHRILEPAFATALENKSQKEKTHALTAPVTKKDKWSC